MGAKTRRNIDAIPPLRCAVHGIKSSGTLSSDSGGLVKDNCCFLSHTIQFNASFLLRINFCFTKRKTPENCVICCCCVRSLTIVISARVGPSKCAKSSRAAPARISATDGQLPFRRTMTSLRISLVSDFFVFSLYKIGILYKRSTIYKIVWYYMTTLFLMCLYSLGCPNEHKKVFFLLQSSKIGKTVFTSQHRRRELNPRWWFFIANNLCSAELLPRNI